MRHAFVVPYANEHEFVELAQLGEENGWEGVFTWESLYGVHAWVQLGAAAMVTRRVRLGTLLTPASRHRPWDLASMVGSVDRLSNGRAVMVVGLGALHDGWLAFEPDEGRRERARKLDESLAIWAGLIEGDPGFSYSGTHYSAREFEFTRPELTPQRPHPPVWVVGARTPGGGRQPSLERAARWQGVAPAIHGPDEDAPKKIEDFASILSEVKQIRARLGLAWEGYEAVVEADSYGKFASLAPADQESWARAGATWWVESWWDLPPGPTGLAEVRRRVSAGPPQ